MKRGDIISYRQMCDVEGTNLQRGMNYRLSQTYSVLLMSVSESAPYADQLRDEGRILIYEGHDIPRNRTEEDPKNVDQPMYNNGGTLTQNGLFFQAAQQFKAGVRSAEKVKVYEKLKAGIWSYNGMFLLQDAWLEPVEGRKVFKFELCIVDEAPEDNSEAILDHTRIIPSSVKVEVWRRDGGRCVKCGSDVNLHFDHIIPYSKGGTSLSSKNIQLLCMSCNLKKHDNIE